MFPQIVLLGALVNLASTSTYIWSTIQGRTRPNRMTFLMWSIAPMIATFAGYVAGVSPWALVPVFLSGFAPFLNFLATFWNPNAYWKLGVFDYFCGALSVLALVLWGVTSDPIVAIVFAILADAFAAVPTVIKSWKYPETEHWGAYTGSTFSAATAFLATPVYTFAALAFPVYLILCNFSILSGIYQKQLRITR